MKKKKTPKRVKPSVRYTRLMDPFNMSTIEIFTLGGHFVPAPSNMPNTIKVLGQTYRVFYHTHIYNEPNRTKRLLGVVLYANRMIVLDGDQTLDDMRETLYHEAGHIYIKAGQSKSEPLANLTYYQIEHMCDLIGEAVCDLARNNPPSALSCG